MEFEEWMTKVDTHVWNTAGVSVHDLPDQPFRDWYIEGIDPQEAARICLEDDDFPA